MKKIAITLTIMAMSIFCFGQSDFRLLSDTSYRKAVVENFINQVNDELIRIYELTANPNTTKRPDTIKTTYDAFKLHGRICVYIWYSKFKGIDHMIIDDEYDRYCMMEIGIDPDE